MPLSDFVVLENGKYTFFYDKKKYRLVCFRHLNKTLVQEIKDLDNLPPGVEIWRDFLGDKAITSLFWRTQHLERIVRDLKSVCLTAEYLAHTINAAKEIHHLPRD